VTRPPARHYYDSVSHNIFSTFEDGNKVDKLSFKMTTTENNKSGKDEVVSDADSMIGEGMRKRAGKNPSALSATSKTLSATSRMYDVDGDGKLDEVEQAMREMDTDNLGYLTNEKVYKVMLEQMKLQRDVFGLKRMSLVFLVAVFLLSLATLATSFAAATLAKDTNVVNGSLVAKDGGGVVGTSNVAATFTVMEGPPPRGEDGSGRDLQNTGSEIWMTRLDADAAWRKCLLGQNVFLKRSCIGGTMIDVPICSTLTSFLTDSSDSSGPIYKSTLISDVAKFTSIKCLTSYCKVDLFLSFVCTEEDYLYSVSWQDTKYACTGVEDLLSLDAIAINVDLVLEYNGLPQELDWKKIGSTNKGSRELKQVETTRGLRGLCSMSRCSWSSCRRMPTCNEMFNCDECRRRQLIKTERVLAAGGLEGLQVELVNACLAALEGQSNGNGQYTQECKDAMGEAKCNALVYSPSSADESVSHSVCQNFAVHARTTVTFGGVVNTIYGGDVGVSPGTAITGDPMLRGGEVVDDSAIFAASVLAAHAVAMSTPPDSTTAATEIGGKTFKHGTYHFESAINIAVGTTVTLDGPGDYLFQAGSTLVTAADTSVILKNGAKAENILWALGTAATLGARSVVEGSILAGTAITFGAQSELRGCALAQSAVTFETAGSVFLPYRE
jgi:hypothetical protein